MATTALRGINMAFHKGRIEGLRDRKWLGGLSQNFMNQAWRDYCLQHEPTPENYANAAQSFSDGYRSAFER